MLWPGRGNGVPHGEVGVADALLGILLILQDVAGDGAAVGAVGRIQFAQRLAGALFQQVYQGFACQRFLTSGKGPFTSKETKHPAQVARGAAIFLISLFYFS